MIQHWLLLIKYRLTQLDHKWMQLHYKIDADPLLINIGW